MAIKAAKYVNNDKCLRLINCCIMDLRYIEKRYLRSLNSDLATVQSAGDN